MDYCICRWWDEAREALFAGDDVAGVVYETESVLYERGNGLDYELNSEIVMQMRVKEAESSDDGSSEGSSVSVSGCEYALLVEWMFLRALKW